MNHYFTEIGGILILAAALAVLVRLFRLPPLIGYIATGLVLGPLGFNYIKSGGELLETLTQIGIAFLLFLVGLELDWVKAKNVFKAASFLAVTQAIGYFAAGMVLAMLTHQSFLTGVYLGAALSFASTVVVIKFLSEARDLNSLHGRLAIGILLVEDIIAIIALVLISGLSGASALDLGQQIFLLLVKTAAMLTLIWTMSQYIFPLLFAKLAKSSEILFVSSIAWCFLFAITMEKFDFPIEIGAFLAGISLAALPYSLEIITRLRSLRDFFLILFFVGLGAHLVLPVGQYALLTIGLTILAVLVKPVISFLTLTANKYRSRTAFLTAVTQSQISEFSLILITLGVRQGQVSAEISSAVTFTMVASVFFSTILFGHRNALYRLLRKPLTSLERHSHDHHEHVTAEIEERLTDHIVIFGYHRMGYHILKKLHQLHHRTVVVDFNPEIISKLRSVGIDCVYGDVEDDEIFDAIHMERASMVVSTIPHHEETLFLIEQIKKKNPKVKLIVTAHEIDYALAYYAKGADYVILPHLLGGEHVADLITQYQTHSLGRYMRHRAEEVKLLRAKNHTLYFD
ncbi:MAG TPA: cation:proton antiporter [Verrucomicrobiae bacterium]|nr:cation:proton antiporter [Verrucomicrobiae bacterium]